MQNCVLVFSTRTVNIRIVSLLIVNVVLDIASDALLYFLTMIVHRHKGSVVLIDYILLMRILMTKLFSNY